MPRALVERALGRTAAATERAAWGFTNRTGVLTPVDVSGLCCSAAVTARMPNTGCA